MTTIQSADNGMSLTHSRTLSDKMRGLHRKKNSNESNTPAKNQQSPMTAPPVKRNPKHMDLMEAVSQQDLSRQYNVGQRDIGTGKENTVQDGRLSRPALSKMEQNSRKIAYDQYLSDAFGLPGQSRPKPAAIQRLNPAQASETRPESDISSKSTDSMEVLFHFSPTDLPVAPASLASSAKDRRPKIQLTIPESSPSVKRSRSNAHLISQMNRQKTKIRSQESRFQEPQSEVSPESSATYEVNEVPARMSIVSPLSSVQMPRPRRPFSAFSLEEMTNEAPEMPHSAPALEKSTGSDSSDDAGDQDDRSSNYSGRSSRSSMSDDPTQEKPIDRNHSIAFSIMSPTAAGVFDGAPSATRMPSRLRIYKSSTSLAVDMNKPLPPEPGMDHVAPLNVPGNARPGSLCRRNAPSPLTISRNSFMDTSPYLLSRMSSVRSKYTPADLDILDAAFAKTSPNPNAQAAFYTHVESSLSQAQMELEAQLGTIKEEPLYHPNMVPGMNDPLQISRGPNTMVPSRQAPPPPSALKLSDGSISGRTKKLQKKTPVHVALQMRSDPSRDSSDSEFGFARRPNLTSAPVRAASIVKANKILGKEEPVPVSMEREVSTESSYSSSRSPDYNDSSSPTTSREDSSTPETDVSSVPETDHAFEEVRARLELLSPKKEPHQFVAYNSFNPHYSQSVSESLDKQSWKAQSNTATADYFADNNAEDRKDSIAPEIFVTPTEGPTQSQVENAMSKYNARELSRVHPSLRLRTGSEDLRPRSLASIAMSEIPDMYATLPSPGSGMETARQSMAADDADRTISANAAEKVLLLILQNLDNLQDLFATATVSRGFYRTFKRHELSLMKNALYGMSPAAWELREMSAPYPGLEGTSPTLDYTPSLYLQHYMRDMYTMIALKSMILIHCESFLRADTITALAGGETERATQIDDAFWRVWTFCQVFGCGSNREEDIVGQIDWLRGGSLAAQQRKNSNAFELGSDVVESGVLYSSPTSFGRGNLGGLSAEELYDMTEIWTCLGVLVRGFQGKRQEARESGIFQNADIADGDIEKEDAILGKQSFLALQTHLLTPFLEEWTYHLLTLAPPTVLDVTSPTSLAATTFTHARTRGYTNWTPPTVSRATFLKEAVSRVYQEKISLQRTPPPSSPKTTDSSPTLPDSSPAHPQSVNDTNAARWRCARHAAEIRAKRNDPSFNLLPTSEDRPMSEFPSVLEALSTTSPTAPPMPPLPTTITITSAHARTPSEIDSAKSVISALVVPAGPQVRDPVDLAVDRFVRMGFDKGKAAKALAETDTGNSIDFGAAMEWLVRERKRDVGGLMHAGYRGRKEGEEESRVSPEAVIREAVGMGIGVPELRIVTSWD